MPTALLYHAIADLRARTEAADRSLFVDFGRLSWQMDELAARGFRTLRLAEYRLAMERGEEFGRRVMLTFDDAYAHVFDIVTPLLESHEFTAVMFVPAGHLAGRNDWDAANPQLAELEIASPEQLRAAARGPWELGSHGWSHVDLRLLDSASRRRELSRARQRLTELAGRPVNALAYPYGLEDPRVRRDARAVGYQMAFMAGRGDRRDLFRLPRRVVRGQEGKKAFLIKASGEFAEVFDEVAKRQHP